MINESYYHKFRDHSKERELYEKMEHYYKVPEHVREGLVMYVLYGIPTGDFLRAILENDLHEACKRADMINRHKLFEIVNFLHNEAIQICWGSEERVGDWINTAVKIRQAQYEKESRTGD